jgi:hypothetical protein
MKSLMMMIMILSLVIVVIVPTVYAQAQQEQQIVVTAPNDTRIIDQSEIESRISLRLTQGELTDYKLY